jgi:hypothetical protein
MSVACFVLACLATARAACPGAGGNPRFIYVNPASGSDSNPGSAARPIATLAAAVLKAKNTASKDVVIKALAGTYDLSASQLVIDFNEGCSRRLTISGPAPGDGVARLVGGKAVTHREIRSGDADWSKIPSASRANVRVANLASSINVGKTLALSSVEGEVLPH